MMRRLFYWSDVFLVFQVFVNKLTDDDDFSLKLRSEYETYKQRCSELETQVQNFHQQNEQLICDLQHVTLLKQSIQEENTKLNEQNLELQKKMQSFLGDMKHSIGGAGQEVYKAYDYSMLEPSSENETQEMKNSITAKQDLEILEMQTAQAVVQEESIRSEELTTSAEQLKEKLRIEKMSHTESKQKLQTQTTMVSKFISLTLCQLGNFSCFYCHLLTIFKINFFKKSCRNTIRHSIGPELDPNCLQRLSADDTRR